MGRKIFVSYKYSDEAVYDIEGNFNQTVRDYVDVIERKIDFSDDIYVGEHDGEDMSDFKDPTIETKLKNKIFNSTVTIVLISKKMKDLWEDENDQWIPWEISYSLSQYTRNGRTSSTNALLCVVLPDEFNSYDYYYLDDKDEKYSYVNSVSFEIIKENRNNLKHGRYGDNNYAVTVKWKYFIDNMDYYINKAVSHQSNYDDYEIKRTV